MNLNILQTKKYYLLPSIQRQIIEQKKIKFSPLINIFNKGFMKEEIGNDGLLKNFKNIEDKTEQKLKAIKEHEQKINEL